MLKKDIRIGAHYIITHHGEKNVVVKVLGEKKHQGHGHRSLQPSPITTRYNCLKLSTGKMIVVKSAAKFQREVTVK